jgi:hypothetical protein
MKMRCTHVVLVLLVLGAWALGCSSTKSTAPDAVSEAVTEAAAEATTETAMEAAVETTAETAVEAAVETTAEAAVEAAVETVAEVAPETVSVVSSHSYKGHENDGDMHAFVNAYPATVGTRLDDCQTCHKGGSFTAKGKTVVKNPCDFCHLIQHPAPDFDEPQPTAFADTLNPYGAGYAAAGRTKDGALSIGADDSDGDGAGNNDEIAALKYPGDPASKPGQPVAPARVFTMTDVKALPSMPMFLLANSNKQQYDDYCNYTGVTLQELLKAAGVDTASPDFTGVTLVAPDGYLKDFTAAEVLQQYPAGLFYAGLDNATLGPECGFVNYPDTLPEGLVDGGPIPGEQRLLLAYARDELPMDPANLDPTSGKLNGEGPFRVIVPQSTPGQPDRGSQYSPTTCDDGHDYNPGADHNAGAMVRGVVAVRVNPLQPGYEDFDYHNGGWAYIDSQSLLVYGFGVITVE